MDYQNLRVQKRSGVLLEQTLIWQWLWNWVMERCGSSFDMIMGEAFFCE
jgi:hypothetical protein